MTTARAGRVGIAVLLALAVGAGAGGCGKYGRPVRSAPAEARDLAAERDAAPSLEVEKPEAQPPEQGGEKKREPEQQEQGGGQ